MRGLLVAVSVGVLGTGAWAQERASKPVGALGKAPVLNGQLKDFSAPVTLKPVPSEEVSSAAWNGRVGWRKDTLYVGVDVTDDNVQPGDTLALTLFFPGGGVTAMGYTFRLPSQGRPTAGANTPSSAAEGLQVGVQRGDKGITYEAAIPARSLPRFPTREPLVFDLCATYEDVDGEASPGQVSNCKDGAMQGDALRLPDEFRKGLKLKVPDAATSLQGHAEGWLGWGLFNYPAWVEADETLNPGLLRSMVAEDVVDTAKVDVAVPDTLTLPDGRLIVTVVAGKDPYAVKGKCDSDQELRLGLYLVKERTGLRVLEWPAATCALGRAVAVTMEGEDGALSIRYSNGATINFAWSGDHFERTELGRR